MSKKLTLQQHKEQTVLRHEAWQRGRDLGYQQGLEDAKKLALKEARVKVLETALDMVKHASQTYASIAEGYSRALMQCSAVIDELKGI